MNEFLAEFNSRYDENISYSKKLLLPQTFYEKLPFINQQDFSERYSYEQLREKTTNPRLIVTTILTNATPSSLELDYINEAYEYFLHRTNFSMDIRFDIIYLNFLSHYSLDFIHQWNLMGYRDLYGPLILDKQTGKEIYIPPPKYLRNWINGGIGYEEIMMRPNTTEITPEADPTEWDLKRHQRLQQQQFGVGKGTNGTNGSGSNSGNDPDSGSAASPPPVLDMQKTLKEIKDRIRELNASSSDPSASVAAAAAAAAAVAATKLPKLLSIVYNNPSGDTFNVSQYLEFQQEEAEEQQLAEAKVKQRLKEEEEDALHYLSPEEYYDVYEKYDDLLKQNRVMMNPNIFTHIITRGKQSRLQYLHNKSRRRGRLHGLYDQFGYGDERFNPFSKDYKKYRKQVNQEIDPDEELERMQVQKTAMEGKRRDVDETTTTSDESEEIEGVTSKQPARKGRKGDKRTKYRRGSASDGKDSANLRTSEESSESEEEYGDDGSDGDSDADDEAEEDGETEGESEAEATEEIDSSDLSDSKAPPLPSSPVWTKSGVFKKPGRPTFTKEEKEMMKMIPAKPKSINDDDNDDDESSSSFTSSKGRSRDSEEDGPGSDSEDDRDEDEYEVADDNHDDGPDRDTANDADEVPMSNSPNRYRPFEFKVRLEPTKYGINFRYDVEPTSKLVDLVSSSDRHPFYLHLTLSLLPDLI